MMRLHSEAFAAQKLSFFVFDNADMIINRHGKENVVRIFKKFCKQNVDDGEMVTQVVITARTWQSTLQFMRDRIPNPLLLIGNFMEAAMYGNMNIQINLNLAVNKLEMARGECCRAVDIALTWSQIDFSFFFSRLQFT